MTFGKRLVQDHAQQCNRFQKILESANIKLAAVATDILGVSGRAMLAALIEGESDPKEMAELAHGRLRPTRSSRKKIAPSKWTELNSAPSK